MLLLLCQTAPTGAQIRPDRRVPPCDTAAPASFPCQSALDQPAVLLEQPALADTGARRTAWVWVFVTDSGTVGASQVEGSAGFEFDMAAVARAKQFRFQPASLNGSAVAAWVLLPVVTTPVPEPCPDMAVPISAGVASFADSEVLGRPEWGTDYRYRGMRDLELDVYLYPRAAWPSPADQASRFVDSLQLRRDRGDLAAFDVQKQAELKVRVRGGRPRREFQLRGYIVRAALTEPNGVKEQDYYAVIPQGDTYVKFRATYEPDRWALPVIEEFVSQVLSARASRPPRCAQ